MTNNDLIWDLVNIARTPADGSSNYHPYPRDKGEKLEFLGTSGVEVIKTFYDVPVSKIDEICGVCDKYKRVSVNDQESIEERLIRELEGVLKN